MNPSAMAARYLFHHRVRTQDAQKNAGAVRTRERSSKREIFKEKRPSRISRGESIIFPAL